MQAMQRSPGPGRALKRTHPECAKSHLVNFTIVSSAFRVSAQAGQQQAPQPRVPRVKRPRTQLTWEERGADVADLDSPKSPWVHVEAGREDDKLAGLAREMQEHGFPAAARPYLADMGTHPHYHAVLPEEHVSCSAVHTW